MDDMLASPRKRDGKVIRTLAMLPGAALSLLPRVA